MVRAPAGGDTGYRIGHAPGPSRSADHPRRGARQSRSGGTKMVRTLLLALASLLVLGCGAASRSEEHPSELPSRENLVCRLLLETKKTINHTHYFLLTPIAISIFRTNTILR